MQTKRYVAPLVVMSLLLFSTIARAETLHVPKQYARIQACIDAAVKGDECVVAPGAYEGSIDFLGKAITLRSSGGAAVTFIVSGRSSVVTCAAGEGSDTILDGFTITRGRGTTLSNGQTFGGGMFNDNASSPTVSNCIFTENLRAGGSGMANRNGSSPTVTGCTFVDNAGAGMYNGFGSSPTVSGCTFANNRASHGDWNVQLPRQSPHGQRLHVHEQLVYRGWRRDVQRPQQQPHSDELHV